jgi:hypothetical protein
MGDSLIPKKIFIYNSKTRLYMRRPQLRWSDQHSLQEDENYQAWPNDDVDDDDDDLLLLSILIIFKKTRGKMGRGSDAWVGPLPVHAGAHNAVIQSDRESCCESEHTPTRENQILNYLKVWNISTTDTERKRSLQKPRH